MDPSSTVTIEGLPKQHSGQHSAIQVALYQPEIPPNTGNIIRLCANTGAALSLIGPLGFELDDRRLRRAGLDYHEFAQLQHHPDYCGWRDTVGDARIFAFTTHARRPHTEISYRPGDILLFGPETRGLPPEVLAEVPAARRLRIPMLPDSRSINLSNAVAVAVYEVWRQFGFAGDCCIRNRPT